MTSDRSQLILKMTLIATVFSIMVISLGAYTRLVHAGLGCPDWPTCYGHIWAPQSSTEIAHANNAFPESPVNLDKTWPEMIHRYLASGLGLMCIIIAWMSAKHNSLASSFPYRHSLAILALVIMQGMFGMWTVTLKLWPQVVTLHLLGGFSTFSLLLLLYLRLSRRVSGQLGSPSEFSLKLKVLAAGGLMLVVVQVMLGGWTSANYAAMACLELPLCSIENLSAQDFLTGFNLLQEIGPNYLGGQLDGGARVAIHVIHRFGALMVICWLTVLIICLYLAKKIQQKKLARLLAIMLLLQVALGLSNVYFNLPLFNALAHNIGGALLVGVLIVINYCLYHHGTKKAG